jgi:Oxidoreductase molybdopterin binding domain
MAEDDLPKEEAVHERTQEDLDRAVQRASARRSRRSFLVAGAAAAGGYGVYRWIDRSEMIGRQPVPLREAFEANADISRGVFHEAGVAATYPKSRAADDLRLNGDFGLKEVLKPDGWRLQLTGVESPEKYPQYTKDVTAFEYGYEPMDPSEQPPSLTPPDPNAKHVRGSEEAGVSGSSLAAGTPGLLLTMEDIRKLPHHELVTEFKCIEGWSEIASWGGARLADLVAAYPPARLANGRLPRYVYMETPDGDYYCGYDMAVALHPQSLLVYEMGGRPITRWHGAPLRLHSPLKYGYKQIKRIGLIAYTDMKPDDYWTKLGYDWYAGL